MTSGLLETDYALRVSELLVWAMVALAAVGIGFITRDWRIAQQLPNLPEQPAPVADRVVVIIPARNEEANIARCLEGVLCQTHDNYEVIVVDDQSTDATPRVVRAYQLRHIDRLRLVPGRPLSAGWVGKCNACWHGAAQTDGREDWLLFLDADTAPQPDLIRGMVALARARSLDVLSVMPLNLLPTWPERLILPVFYQFALTAFPLQLMLSEASPPRSVLANGQCLLIRREAYWAIGGHEAVKDKVLEDIELAQALRRAGFRVGIALGFSHIRVRMYRSMAEIAQGLGKHAVAGRKASGPRAFWAVARLSLTLLVPMLLVLASVALNAADPSPAKGVAGLAALAVLGAQWAFWAQRYRTWYGLPRRIAPLAPIGWLLYLWIVVRSTAEVWMRRGVRWKERVYG
ncbi:MAG: glycosyltransferase [Thermoflexales bacterium]